jgi:hypothetical protein
MMTDPTTIEALADENVALRATIESQARRLTALQKVLAWLLERNADAEEWKQIERDDPAFAAMHRRGVAAAEAGAFIPLEEPEAGK